MLLRFFLASISFAMTGMVYADAHLEKYIAIAEQNKLDQDVTWQRLMYSEGKNQSEVAYSGYFFAKDGQTNLKAELRANIEAIFQPAVADQSIQCRFPARSQWLIQQLKIDPHILPKAECPQLERWISEIKPYKATLIYATDFMGNPSSMFGHTLLRLDPKDQKQLNLVSYAVNYAATVNQTDNWSYAWKGLTGQYPGEYSLLPYYRKVKEYGDLESRDLWEYELNFNEQETTFLVKHIWEMQHVSFPYYFVSDNCAYRLLGLIDLVRPDAVLKDQFKRTSIPVETLKALKKQNLVKDIFYRPALETQLLSQAEQHGQYLAQTAHQIAFSEVQAMSQQLAAYSVSDQAKILEMSYDDLYLHFIARKVEEAFAQPRLRQLLMLRSKIQLDKQREDVSPPKADPSQGHSARNLAVHTGEVQGEHVVQLSSRQAYHDLIDPQQGYRIGTQLLFLDGSVQFRDDELKLTELNLLSVNAYNPVTPFKTPLSWGFDLGWKQEALEQDGQFSEREQHGAAYLNTQAGYSWANAARTHLCYGQMQLQIQGSKALDQGWRAGAGPVFGCQNIWSEKVSSTLRAELPFWSDSSQLNLRLNTQVQYAVSPQHALRAGFSYQEQNAQDWHQWQIGYSYYY
ncbi:DUF4105 domain-containing protein [Acinetobacter tianfuensis]|uniref:DUF4105 domain-containing protein n=1 Tax=Acinetobacter tianfuensis TaxID=2419603 RepID=A0A3A8EI93_9GAMM|nr:DUF4105 domain-containing protein [Acinetobacter tianfuensis]